MDTGKYYEPKKEFEIKDGVFKTPIDGLFYLSPNFFPDNRGFFAELGHTYKIEEIIGIPFKIAQINHSRSEENVVRGLHAEGWNKLIVVTAGVAFSALVDVRPESPTFATVVNTLMGPDNGGLHGAFFIKQGIANSVCSVKAPVDYLYFVDKLYKDRDPKGDQAISLFDPDLKIDWPIVKEKMIISERDRNSVTLREKFPQKFTA